MKLKTAQNLEIILSFIDIVKLCKFANLKHRKYVFKAFCEKNNSRKIFQVYIHVKYDYNDVSSASFCSLIILPVAPAMFLLLLEIIFWSSVSNLSMSI